MKRNILTMCVAFLLGINCHAASDNDTTRYLASTIRQNWFISVNASTNWWQGTDRIPAGNFTTLNGPTFGGGVSLGKWITHKIGLRLAYDINPAQSYINGRHVNLKYLNYLYADETPITVVQDGVQHDYYKTSFMFHDAHIDVLLSPRDLVEGYYYKRLYVPLVVVGMGCAFVSNYASIIKSFTNRGTDAVNYELSYNVGLMNCFRINNFIDLDLTFMLQGARWSIDSWTYEFETNETSQRKSPRKSDFNYKASLGFLWFPFGKVYEHPYNYEKEMKELRKRLKECEENLANIDIPDEVGSTVEIVHDTAFIVSPGEFVSYPFSIFFHLDSYELMSGRDLVNLREIVKVALDHDCKIKLRGSCDSATATVPYNQRLSENRCRKIQSELIKLGFPEDRITYDAVGGVAELDPTKYDRRVIVTLIKDN
ncbi:MAG: hypothetical protein J6P73_06095 [Bacteroidales bacterium]|nr:hypothetical protein [Bacteroidales bacterium]